MILEKRMAIPSSNEISFNSFYLTEFFNIVYEKASNQIAESHFTRLKELGKYLLKEDNIIDGLKQVALYQNSNDLAIFLFDMIERANDYGPQIVYNTIDILASDFVNLYSLMMEDEDTENTFKNIIDDFKNKYASFEKEKHLEEFFEITQKDVSTPEISPVMDLASYYKIALSERVAAANSNLLSIVFSDIDAGINEDQIPEALKTIFNNIKAVYPAMVNSNAANHHDIEKRAEFVNEEVEKINSIDPEIISIIVTNQSLVIPGAPPEQHAKVTEQDEPDSSIESLLVDYFRSEVEDWADAISTLFTGYPEHITAPSQLKQLIAALKSLKELSMIHGYGGLEHVAHLLTNEFEKLDTSSFTFSAESPLILLEIVGLIKHVENFSKKSKSAKAIANIHDKIDQLRETYSEVATAELVDEIAEEQITDKLEAEWFGMDDSRFDQAISDVIKVIYQKVQDACNSDEPAAVLNRLFKYLHFNSIVFPADFDSLVVSPLEQKYMELLESGNQNTDNTQAVLAGIWQEIIDTSPKQIEVEALNERMRAIPVIEAGIDLNNPKVAEALASVIARQRELLAADFEAAFDPEKSPDTTNNFLSFTDTQLKLTGAEHYQKFISFVLDQIKASRTRPYPAQIISEFSAAFNLFVDRLGHRGFDANCDDVIDALSDVLSTEQAPIEKITEADIEPVLDANESEDVVASEEAPSSDSIKTETLKEDDDLSLFRDEASSNINIIKDNLAVFKSGQDRIHLRHIENAAHSIRSAAHMLNFESATKLASSIEEISEVFGQSDVMLPENMVPYLEQATAHLEQLLENPDTDSSEVIALLDSLLDQVAIQDSGSSDANADLDAVSDVPTLETPTNLDDGHLFSSDSGEDEELQNIFKEESVNFLNDISIANSILEKDYGNIPAVEKLGYAAHSLKSASKMLGFIEISQISDNIEKLAGAITDGNVIFDAKLFEKINEALKVLSQLSDNKAIDSTVIAKLIDSLDISLLEKKQEIGAADEGREPLPENMLEVFVEEASELIEDLNDDFLELEKLPESEMILANALRNLHTIKGSAYVTKFNHIGDLAHKMEDYFQFYKTSSSDNKSDVLNSSFMALDLIADMVKHAELSGTDEVDQLTSRLAAIDNKLFSFQSLAMPESSFKSEAQPINPVPKKSFVAKSGEKNVLKIDTEYMDKMVDMASELMINQTQLGANLHALKEILANLEGEKKQIRVTENILEDTILRDDNEDSEEVSGRQEEIRKISGNIKDLVRAVNLISSDLNHLTDSFDQNIGQLSNLSKLLHGDMLKTRMVPIGNLFNRYPRAVRDMAKKQGKKVNLIIEDNNTELDRVMVEGLAEPILHIIRNAIDHGIETVEERKAQGKTEIGTLVLRARQERSQILIDIEDDGHGINVNRVKEQILKRELVEKEVLERMSDAQILDYIFYPDFTTRLETTKDSGRGIGLNAVATQLQKLKGNIRLKTEQNVGSSFLLRVPLTLVISHALMVKVANQTIAIPVLSVQESIQFHKDEIIEDAGNKYIRVRGRLLPYVPLLDILKFNGQEPVLDEPDKQLAVVIFDAGVSTALGVQAVVGRQEVVIKSLGSHLQNVEYLAGGTIMANGEVALILDFARVIKKVENQYFGNAPEKNPIKKFERKKKMSKPTESKTVSDEPEVSDEDIKVRVVKARSPKIMIVDDSNSVRNFVGSILERNNFLTVKAINGADALKKLKTEQVDLVITDLEMPKMHGFDLISNIRQQKKFAGLPIIILTGRAGMKHRQTGEELGANAFIVKPFKEYDLLASIGEFIKLN